MATNKKTVIFDFDGTLADTFEYLVGVMMGDKDDFSIESLDRDMLYELKSLPLDRVIKRLHVPFFIVPFLLEKFQKRLGKLISKVDTFDGMEDVLAFLQTNGYEMGILTSNSRLNVQKFLEANKLEKYFSFISAEGDLFAKDKALKKLIEKYHLSKETTIYIGDEARDITACTAAGIKIVSVGWGFNSHVLLQKMNPEYFAGSVVDLKRMILTALH